MPLTLADFTETIECELKKIATVGHERQDVYFCLNCRATVFVKARSGKPECRVSLALGQAVKG